MNSRLKKLAAGRFWVLYFFLAVFAVATWFFGNKQLAVAEAAVTLVLTVGSIIGAHQRKKHLVSYVESVIYETENAKSSTLMHFPLPIAVFRLKDSGIIWGNDSFFEMCGPATRRLDACIVDLVPEFSCKWLYDGKTVYGSLLEIGGRKYRIHGNIIRSEDKETDEQYMGITYWVDVTDYDDLRIEYEESRPVAAVIIVDNLDELYRNQPDRTRSDIREGIEEKLRQWGEENSAIIRRYERDRYLAVFEKKNVDAMKADKFKVISEIHKVENPLGIEASICIGLGEEADTLGESLQFADAAADLAISRGGDQAVVKNRRGFDFFGGRGVEIEKRTKVKSRVMANAISGFMQDSAKVFIMGHKYADLDSVGSAAGIVCMARKLGIPAYIVTDPESNASRQLVEKLKADEHYAEVFIDTHEAMLKADSKTLLVVVDTSRPEQTEDRDLIEACSRVVVIDHHRVAATFIQSALLSFVEPYASSVSELVTELLQEIVDRQDILGVEAEAMLAGMVLDTKSFTVRTGERTFEAAAYLRRAGADTERVKRLLQSDMTSTMARYDVLRSAQLYRNIALAVPDIPQTRVVTAQAADELLNISGVDASVVAVPDGKGGAFVSARSIGDVNAQILMEKLGGGGNRSVAAAQFAQITMPELTDRIRAAIDEYFSA